MSSLEGLWTCQLVNMLCGVQGHKGCQKKEKKGAGEQKNCFFLWRVRKSREHKSVSVWEGCEDERKVEGGERAHMGPIMRSPNIPCLCLRQIRTYPGILHIFVLFKDLVNKWSQSNAGALNTCSFVPMYCLINVAWRLSKQMKDVSGNCDGFRTWNDWRIWDTVSNSLKGSLSHCIALWRRET